MFAEKEGGCNGDWGTPLLSAGDIYVQLGYLEGSFRKLFEDWELKIVLMN